MSFITKRERVFNELDLYDLPPRNEGKLKAYASCTDARAWSHFGSSKTEHLTELIKRNTDLSVPAKYVPTTVIVDTLMVSKNLEISRLKRKIEEFEQMLAVYEELELDCAQKCEIAKAHADIKAANKDLDDLCLNLDMSTYTDGLETESFETGKSRSAQYSMNASIKSRGAESDRSCGDAWTVMSRENNMTSQANQASPSTMCVCVSVEDPRIEEMQDEIIAKDAKLGAMHNTMAIMENDICEPFVIYAHIYTALEKIYGILSQNSKYKQYLNLMTAGKDTRCSDIKGKILFKLKVLEKFCQALIAPCSKEFSCANATDCSCYRIDVDSNMSLTYRITPEECASSNSTKRSHLVADIMEHEEMKDIIGKDNKPEKTDEFEVPKVLDTAYIINTENQKRIESLQVCYGDLLNCYENLKHETCCLRIKCTKYDELESELERLHSQLKEYNSLWNEKEHYRKRSEDLDSLKQQYMVLAEESSGLELKLRAESEINHIKTNTIEELRDQNITLEKNLNELHNSFEKDKNNLQRLLQESECKCICQEQQIKSLSAHIVKLLEEEPEKPSCEDAAHMLFLTEENETLREQVKQYQDIELEFQNKMLLVNELESKISEWRAEYEKEANRNKYLEDCIVHYKEENERILNDKSDAVENLEDDIKSKSIEIMKLTNENQNLSNKYENLIKNYENELNISRQESIELGEKLKRYNDLIQKQEDLTNIIENNQEEHIKLNALLKRTSEENEKLKNDLETSRNEDASNKKSLENAMNEALNMEQMLAKLKYDVKQYENLKDEFERVNEEKHGLENELRKKTSELKNAMFSIKLNSKESSELLKQSTSIQKDLSELTLSNQNYASKYESIKKELDILQEENTKIMRDFQIKNEELSNLNQTLHNKEEENRILNENLKTLQSQCLETNDNLKSLEDENKENQMVLDALKQERSALMEQLKYHNELENDHQKLQLDFDTIVLEKNKLRTEFEALSSDLQRTLRENGELKITSGDLLAHNTELEKAFTTMKELLSPQSSPSGSNPYTDLMHEISQMKKEKLTAQNKIRNLLDKLDESEQLITSFQEDINMRDHRIATMQNYVNDLEDEVRRLQDLLEHAIQAGSDIQSTNESVSQARKQIDAHHSKAAHNMKLELAMLQRSKSKLESKLSISKSHQEMTNKNVQKYLSEIQNLKNDLQHICDNIKDLEISSVGHSELPSDNCELPQILDSLHKIRKAFDSTHVLKQTLDKVRSLLSKADEAKTNLENEKQRIINEKEDAAKDKFILEQQLNDLKNELDKQNSHDRKLIKHLENEICNKNLIIEKINQSTETQVEKLKDELKSFRDLYNHSLTIIRELEEKLEYSKTELDSKENIITNLIEDFENKSKEVEKLHTEISNLNGQKLRPLSYRDICSQTDDITKFSNIFKDTDFDKNIDQSPVIYKEMAKNHHKKKNIKPVYDISHHKFPTTNEVKILAVEVEPTLDFVRNSYLNYKIGQLSQRQLDNYSFPSLNHDIHSEQSEKPQTSFNFDHDSQSDPYVWQDMEIYENNTDLIHIYQSPSNEVYNSTTIIELDNEKHNAVTDGFKNKSVQPEIENNNKFSKIEPNKHQNGNELHTLDKKILLIYEDKKKQLQSDVINKLEQQPIDGTTNVSHVTVPISYDRKANSKKVLATSPTETASLETKEHEKDKIKPNVPHFMDPKSYNSEVKSEIASTSFLPESALSENKVNKLKPKVLHITEPESYNNEMNAKKASATFLTETYSSETIEDKVDKSKPKDPHMTEPKKSDGEVKSKIISDTFPIETASSETKENKVEKSKPKFPHTTEPESYDGENKSKKVSAIILTETTSLETKEKKSDNFKPKLNINLPQVKVDHHTFSTTTDNESDSLDFYPPGGPYPIKYTSSDTEIISTHRISSPDQNVSKFDTLPVRTATTSNSNYIRLESRSSMNIPFKESSFTKNKIQSGYELLSSVKQSSAGHSVVEIFENHAKRKLQNTKSLSKNDVDDNQFRLLNKNNSKKRKTERVKVEQQNYNQNDLSNQPLGPFLVSPKPEIKATREYNIERKNLTGFGIEPDQNVINESYDMSIGKTHLVIDEKDKVNEIQQQSLIGVTLREIDVFDPAIIRDEKTNNGTKNDKSVEISHKNNLRVKKIVSQHVIDDVHYEGSIDHLVSDSKSKSKSSRVYLDQAEDFETSFKRFTSFDDRRENDVPENYKSDSENRAKSVDQDVMAKLDQNSKYYEDMIYTLRKSLNDVEKDHKMQIEAIKIQYDRNINKIINEHNQGVKNIQNIHEDTLYDVMRIHENEVENLRLISIEALRNVEKLESECIKLKSKPNKDTITPLDEVPTCDYKCVMWKKPKKKPQSDTKVLTKTVTQAFNVPPKVWVHGPCTCSLDINLSDTIRNIFEQVDVDQRKMAEMTYLKYISNKIANGNIENLDTQELSFLHLKVCRTWKMKLNKEEALQKKIDSLEVELINRQRNAQQHLADLDRKVALEKQRLEEVREAVCRNMPSTTHSSRPFTLQTIADNNCYCGPSNMLTQELTDHRSAGDLTTAQTGLARMKKPKSGNRGAKKDTGERRDRRFYTDEPPTRLRRQHDRAPPRPARK